MMSCQQKLSINNNFYYFYEHCGMAFFTQKYKMWEKYGTPGDIIYQVKTECSVYDRHKLQWVLGQTLVVVS